MASPLPPEQQASYAVIIDEILAVSDLTTVSAKRIRKGLQDKVGYDLTSQKQAITELIMERFDKYQNAHPDAVAAAAPEPAPTTNGNHSTSVSARPTEPSYPQSPQKRKVESAEEDELSDLQDSPPPPKKAKKVVQETDEQMAKRMQAELNAQARATRGGGPKRKAPVKKEKRVKKKSAAKIRSDDDSEVDGSAHEKPEKERKGGFHKLMNLSEPLQALLGESQLSRPQTVKRIWAYVKQHDLQQPDDKRNIVCDDALRAVFKTDKVHMFTMNKILATQLYPADE